MAGIKNKVSARLVRGVSLTLGLVLATTAIAQQAQTGGQGQQPSKPSSAATLNLPQNPELFGSSLPSVVKATAIVNGRQFLRDQPADVDGQPFGIAVGGARLFRGRGCGGAARLQSCDPVSIATIGFHRRARQTLRLPYYV